jgi:L-fuculose-phosphate aldolase
MAKSLLDGYVGVKFKAVCLDEKLPEACEDCVSLFKQNGGRLLDYQMAPANGGNMSARWQKGFLITASGCNLGCIEDYEVIYVEDFSIEDKVVTYRGKRPPSSETFLHGLLYKEKADIFSVVHAHDEVATSMDLARLLTETEREEPYGTVELASLCLETFKKGGDLIVLKNHGYVAIGLTLTKVTNRIIDMHNHLLGVKGS